MQEVVIITNLAVVLVIGVLSAMLAEKLKLARILFLLIAGIILSLIRFNGESVVTFPESFIIVMAVITLILVVFEGTSKMNLKEADKPSGTALKLVTANLVLNAFILGPLLLLLFMDDLSARSVLLAISFAILATGTDAAAVFSILSKPVARYRKWFDLLKLESVINTPIVVVIPLIILEIVKNLSSERFINAFVSELPIVVQRFVVGLGSGVLVGVIIIKTLRNSHKIITAQLGLLTSSLIAYVLAENFNGDGVIAVATLGIVFATVSMRHKEEIKQFNTTASLLFEIIVFTMLGLIIPLPKNWSFILRSIIAFFFLLLSRWLAVKIAIRDVTTRERVFLTLEAPKGIAVAVVTISLLLSNVQGVEVLSSLSFMFIIYSLITGSVVVRFQESLLSKQSNQPISTQK